MKTNYFINKEKGVVVCRIQDDCRDPLIFDIKGIAYCSPEDEFNERTGRRIAELRAHIEYHRLMKQWRINNKEAALQEVLESKQKTQYHQNIINKMQEQLKEIK